jgi:DNA adenine methylase
MCRELAPPFNYFGGKRAVASRIWDALGDVAHYVEPFFGSGAVLLKRPISHFQKRRIETINDYSALVVNIWRAMKYQPAVVAGECAWQPLNEADYHAFRHWLCLYNKTELREQLNRLPTYCEPLVASRYLYVLCAAIGGAPECEIDHIPEKVKYETTRTTCSHVGINSSHGSVKVLNERTCFDNVGINRLADIQTPIDGFFNRKHSALTEWFLALQERFVDVTIECGDWTRICTPVVLEHAGYPVGIFFDPPYEKYGTTSLYGVCSGENHGDVLSPKVREFCKEYGSNPHFRIVLAGYYDEHDELLEYGWKKENGKANGGFSGKTSVKGEGARTARERLWMSPYCLQSGLF